MSPRASLSFSHSFIHSCSSRLPYLSALSEVIRPWGAEGGRTQGRNDLLADEGDVRTTLGGVQLVLIRFDSRATNGHLREVARQLNAAFKLD